MDRSVIEHVVREVLKEVVPGAKKPVPEKRRLAKENIARWLGHSPESKKDQLAPIPPVKEKTEEKSEKIHIPKPKKAEKLQSLVDKTPARLAVWRAGTRYLTRVALKLRGDHAIAKDAVYAELKPDFAQTNGWIHLSTKAKNKEEFLLRPDLGRQLDEASIKTVQEKGIKNPDVQITVADGLSAWATERYARPMVDELVKLCQQAGQSVGSIFCVKYSRIAIQDVIGEIVGAKVSLILLGERPGLGSGDSLSNYMIYGPKVGAVNARKSMISNIHNGGYPPQEAARITMGMIKRMFEQKCSGIELKA